MSFNGARHELEIRADFARDRLLETIGAIDRRRHEVMNWRLQLRRHAGRAAGLAAVLLGIAGLVAGAGVFRAKQLVAHRRRERLRALARFWEHPERVAPQRRRPFRAFLTGMIGVVALIAASRARR